MIIHEYPYVWCCKIYPTHMITHDHSRSSLVQDFTGFILLAIHTWSHMIILSIRTCDFARFILQAISHDHTWSFKIILGIEIVWFLKIYHACISHVITQDLTWYISPRGCRINLTSKPCMITRDYSCKNIQDASCLALSCKYPGISLKILSRIFTRVVKPTFKSKLLV